MLARRAHADVLASIAANVRNCRTSRGLSQEALAELADLDLRQLQRVESGTVNFGVVAFVAVARALGVSPAVLIKPAGLPVRRRGRPAKARQGGTK